MPGETQLERKSKVSKKSGNAQAEEEYLRAAWVEQQHIEKEFEVLVELELHPTSQKGVFCLHCTAVGVMKDVALLLPLALNKKTFPNAENASFAGFLWAQVIKLGNQVSEMREAEKAEAARHNN